ncbi:MAG: ComEA family DNA-binding protein [Campylobacter sp.]
MKNFFKMLLVSMMLFSALFATVNINTASKQELMSLNGIGEAKANAIIEYRQAHKFNQIDEIKNVKGIGDKIFDKIKNDIEVVMDTNKTTHKDMQENSLK